MVYLTAMHMYMYVTQAKHLCAFNTDKALVALVEVFTEDSLSGRKERGMEHRA